MVEDNNLYHYWWTCWGIREYLTIHKRLLLKPMLLHSLIGWGLTVTIGGAYLVKYPEIETSILCTAGAPCTSRSGNLHMLDWSHVSFLLSCRWRRTINVNYRFTFTSLFSLCEMSLVIALFSQFVVDKSICQILGAHVIFYSSVDWYGWWRRGSAETLLQYPPPH